MVRGSATDPDDLLQDAVVLLMRKADQYDPARGAVTTFAGLYCWAARRDAARRRRLRPDSDPDRRIPLDTSRLADGNGPTPIDVAERRELLGVVGLLPTHQRELRPERRVKGCL